jgi:hypothetical protein
MVRYIYWHKNGKIGSLNEIEHKKFIDKFYYHIIQIDVNKNVNIEIEGFR